MAKAVVFNRSDVRILQELINAMRNGRLNLGYRQPTVSTGEDQVSPEVYIVKTPADGIPPVGSVGTGSGTASDPADGDILGSAECEVYKVDALGTVYKVDEENARLLTVYNITEFWIRGNTLITAKRDKFGTWIAERPSIAIYRGLTANDVLPGETEDLVVYEGEFGGEVATGRILPSVRNETSCTILAGLMATAIEVPEITDGWQFLIGKTS